MTPNTIGTLEDMGYTTGIAHGDATVEQTALDAAITVAQPAAIAVDAAAVAVQSVHDLANAGLIPEDVTPGELAAKIATEIAGKLEVARNAKVEFHQRALEIAQGSPTVWHVDGPGVSTYVSAKDDGTGWDPDQQTLIDALADPGTFSERVYQVDNPEAMDAMNVLIAQGHTVERPTPGADLFVVDGTDHTAADLPGLAAG